MFPESMTLRERMASRQTWHAYPPCLASTNLRAPELKTMKVDKNLKVPKNGSVAEDLVALSFQQ
jgi:hypothetical protein